MTQAKKTSETITENIFREVYGANTFIEKSAIPSQYCFQSKKSSIYKGYPDFFREEDNYIIVVESKAVVHKDAINEVKFYFYWLPWLVGAGLRFIF